MHCFTFSLVTSIHFSIVLSHSLLSGLALLSGLFIGLLLAWWRPWVLSFCFFRPWTRSCQHHHQSERYRSVWDLKKDLSLLCTRSLCWFSALVSIRELCGLSCYSVCKFWITLPRLGRNPTWNYFIEKYQVWILTTSTWPKHAALICQADVNVHCINFGRMQRMLSFLCLPASWDSSMRQTKHISTSQMMVSMDARTYKGGSLPSWEDTTPRFTALRLLEAFYQPTPNACATSSKWTKLVLWSGVCKLRPENTIQAMMEGVNKFRSKTINHLMMEVTARSKRHCRSYWRTLQSIRQTGKSHKETKRLGSLS